MQWWTISQKWWSKKNNEKIHIFQSSRYLNNLTSEFSRKKLQKPPMKMVIKQITLSLINLNKHNPTIFIRGFVKDFLFPPGYVKKTNYLDTGRKFNVHKTFRRRPRHLLNVLSTLNLRPVSRGSSLPFVFRFRTERINSIDMR